MIHVKNTYKCRSRQSSYRGHGSIRAFLEGCKEGVLRSCFHQVGWSSLGQAEAGYLGTW